MKRRHLAGGGGPGARCRSRCSRCASAMRRPKAGNSPSTGAAIPDGDGDIRVHDPGAHPRQHHGHHRRPLRHAHRRRGRRRPGGGDLRGGRRPRAARPGPRTPRCVGAAAAGRQPGRPRSNRRAPRPNWRRPNTTGPMAVGAVGRPVGRGNRAAPLQLGDRGGEGQGGGGAARRGQGTPGARRGAAPADGTILTRNIEIGQTANAGGEPLFRLAQGGEVELRGQVAEQDLPLLKLGQAASVHLTGVAQAFHGTVRLLGAVIDPQTRLGSDPHRADAGSGSAAGGVRARRGHRQRCGARGAAANRGADR